MSDKKNFPIGITLFAALCLTTLLGLGIWQLQRLDWKLDKITALDNAYAQEAELLSAETLKTGVKEYQKAQLQGVFLSHTSPILIQSKTFDGQRGYHLIRAVHIDDIAVFVNMGWVAKDFNATALTSEETFDLTGVFYPAERSNAFVPDNSPEQGLWYWPDTTAMAEITNQRHAVQPVFRVMRDDTNHAASAGYEQPIPVGDKPELRNDHLQYAAFWFTMACLFIIIFMIFLSRRMREAAR